MTTDFQRGFELGLGEALDQLGFVETLRRRMVDALGAKRLNVPLLEFPDKDEVPGDSEAEKVHFLLATFAQIHRFEAVLNALREYRRLGLL